MTLPLQSVLVRRPDQSFGVADPARWHYSGAPDLDRAQQEHDALVQLLRDEGATVHFHEEPLPGKADALFLQDPALLTDRGAIILSMGKELRRGEEAALERCLVRLGVPILGRLEGTARAEGGDTLWLDPATLAVGIGFRTNAEGIRQLAGLLEALSVRVVPVELPCYGGESACLHLGSLISLVDDDLAVVYPPLLSVPFYQQLLARGIRLIEVPPDEFATLGTNVLALAPRRCVLLEGNPVTQRRLEEAGCTVWTYRGDEISLKAEGGPTCLTRSLRRGPA